MINQTYIILLNNKETYFTKNVESAGIIAFKDVEL